MSIDPPASNHPHVPPEEIPGPDDWFVWPPDSEISTTTAVRVCFHSWLAPGQWMSELATLCNSDPGASPDFANRSCASHSAATVTC
jgi:hypothetical protein